MCDFGLHLLHPPRVFLFSRAHIALHSACTHIRRRTTSTLMQFARLNTLATSSISVRGRSIRRAYIICAIGLYVCGHENIRESERKLTSSTLLRVHSSFCSFLQLGVCECALRGECTCAQCAFAEYVLVLGYVRERNSCCNTKYDAVFECIRTCTKAKAFCMCIWCSAARRVHCNAVQCAYSELLARRAANLTRACALSYSLLIWIAKTTSSTAKMSELPGRNP